MVPADPSGDILFHPFSRVGKQLAEPGRRKCRESRWVALADNPLRLGSTMYDMHQLSAPLENPVASRQGLYRLIDHMPLVRPDRNCHGWWGPDRAICTIS